MAIITPGYTEMWIESCMSLTKIRMPEMVSGTKLKSISGHSEFLKNFRLFLPV
jgi:hypothetical protein